MWVTSTRVLAKGGETSSGREKFLAQFRRDPILVPIPFLKPGQSFDPVYLGGSVCTDIATILIMQEEQMAEDMRELCH